MKANLFNEGWILCKNQWWNDSEGVIYLYLQGKKGFKGEQGDKVNSSHTDVCSLHEAKNIAS